MRLFRPEFCVGVAVLLSFLSLTILMLSSAPNSNREAAATGIARSLQVRTWERDSQAVASSPALLALDSRLESMERHLQELRGPSFAYPQYPAYGQPPAMGASQGQMDALVQQMREAFAKSTKENQVVPQHQDYWGGWEEPTTTTPVRQGQIKELREAVERLSHQTDDRFSSLMQPGKAKGDNPSMLGHACRSPPCSRDPKSCKSNGNCCADLMFEMLVDFSNFLRRNNVTFMLSEGTLLGAVRDQDIIPYTADLDIFVPREGWEKAMLINEEPPASKSYHFMVDPDQPHCARLCAVWQGYPANRAPFDEHFPWDTESLGNDLAYYMDIYDEDMDFAQAMKHLVYPPSTVMIRNVSFPAPREQEIYVAARYGPSWRVPDHQAREIAEKYPTLEEAKAWSMNMLMLHAAQKDATIGFRLLERASVDYKSGDIVIRGLSQGHPQETAKNLVLEEFQMEDRKVKGGKVTVYPPERDESQILDYVLYWAKEEVSSWSDEILIRRIDSGLDSLEDAPAPKERDEGNEWYRPEPEPRPLGRIWRCKGVEDPFKSCSTRGVPLQVSIPHDIQVPNDATHLAVAAENEVGESQKLTAVNLNGDQEGDGFSTRVFFSILKGFEAQNCATGGHQLEKEGWEQIVALMVLRTNSGMKEALTKLGEWLAPVSEILEDCQAETVKQRFSAALSRLKTGEMHYKPGQALAVDGISIFSHLNSAIQTYRNTRQSFSNFGTELGTLLSRLAPEVSTSEEPESSSSRSGLKLRSTGSDMTDMTGATAE